MASNDTTVFPSGDADPTRTIGERPDPGQPPTLDDLVVSEPAITPRGLLGHGGMGLVQRAIQTRMRREVAAKVLLDDGSPERVQALVREAWVAGALEHPNIVPVHDVFLDEEHRPTLVMKRVEGQPWKELLEDAEAVRALGADDVVAWHLDVLCSVCRAVEFAHSRGVLHRDIKPSNVMVGSFGEVYLLDWGIAISLEPDPEGRFPAATERMHPTGTPVYMAPEMARADGHALRPASDVFLLGAVLYEVLTGRPPRTGETRNEVLAALEDPIPIDPSLPEDLRQLLEQSLAPDTGARPSASAFRRAIERHLARRGLLTLLERTRARAERLQRALHTGDPDRIALYDLLGEIRFGVREVRQSWPENHETRQLEHDAVLALARYECDAHDPRAAELLLADREVPPELAARIEALKQNIEQDQQRLVHLTADASATTGQEARLAAVAGLALLWVGTPIVLPLLGVEKSYLRALTVVAAQLLATLSLAVLLRNSLLSTRFNRTFLAFLTAQPLFAGALIAAAAHWGLSVDQASVLELIGATALVTVAAMTLDRRVLLSVATLGIASAIAVFEPSWVRVVSVPCYAGLALNVWLIRERLGAPDTGPDGPNVAQ